MKNIIKLYNGRGKLGIVKSTKYTKNTPYPLIGNGKGENSILGYTSKAVITKECVTISGAGTIGYPEYRNYSFYPLDHVACLIPFLNNDAKFIRYALDIHDFMPMVGLIPTINSNYINNIKIFTTSFTEQQKIGELFNKFDKLIDKINNKIKKLKDIKESFMNREFSKLNN
ncbi:restriction endonuclease subunit S [Mycoplasma sp. E35C]|uniref:restriction endonuclease subunit S n=1 Tax=Mycoplasma sp. E35C TaxID=2801918 RepID=UPI001CA3BA09|nr:restriction endonuclease subunit S [Mycoplasma sp. E35C]QZX48904.1 restriction endonuclease subunit S [Mycoplasma sp. E35C]